MKLAYEDKVQIYELRRQEGEYLKWGVNASILHTKEKLVRKQITLIQRQFEAANPMEKCYTDVTEFAIPNSTHKLYLSPVLDGFNSEIIAYNLSTSPNLEQVKSMLDQSPSQRSIMKIQFPIVTRVGNTNISININF